MSSRAGRLPGCGSGTGVVAAASPVILISLFFSVVHAGRDLVANRHGTLLFKGPDAHFELPAMATASIFETGMTNLSTDVFQSISRPDKVDLSNNVDRGPDVSGIFCILLLSVFYDREFLGSAIALQAGGVFREYS